MLFAKYYLYHQKRNDIDIHLNEFKRLNFNDSLNALRAFVFVLILSLKKSVRKIGRIWGIW